MQPNHCANCDEPIAGTARFCPACGQKTNLHRLTLKDVLHDGFHYFTHADKGIVQLVKALATKPGVVAREYIAGKRKKYFPPLNFFLLVAALFLFAATVTHRDKQMIETRDSVTAGVTGNMTLSEKKLQAQQIVKQRSNEAYRYIARYTNYVAMLAAPYISLIVWLMYRRSGYNYTEHLTANLYLVGFTNLVHSLVVSPLIYFTRPYVNMMIFTVLFALFEIFYRTVFYYRFINDPIKQGLTKTIVKSAIAVLAWFALIFVFMAVFIAMGFIKQQ